MTIGSASILSDDFTRADNTATLGSSFTVQCADGTATTFGVVGNKAELTSGGSSGVLSWAKISPALFGAAPQRVRVCVNEGTVGAKIGAVLRLTTSGNTPTCYFLGKEGSGAFIRRYDAGVATDLVAFSYVGAWDGVGGNFFLQLDADTDGSGNIVLTVSSASSEGGTYTSRATFTDSSASKITGAGTAGIATATYYNGANLKTWDYIRVIGTAASAAANLTSPIPSGTLGTTTTATIGATTDQNTGTLYYVASTDSSKILTATGPQVVAGQGADSVSLARNGSNTISSTTPTISATGFSSGTTYYFAVAQSNANGVSAPVTGSFTTAVAYRSFSITLRDAAGALLNGVNLKFWTRTTKDGAAVDGGSTGLSITCGSNGIFSNSALTIAAGTYYLFWEDPSDPYKSHWKVHDFT